MDSVPGPGHSVTWIFTLGSPTAELMEMLSAWTADTGLNWVLVPVYTPGLKSLRKERSADILSAVR